MSDTNIKKQLEDLARQEKALAKQKQLLVEQQKKAEEAKQKIRKLVDGSGLGSPREVVNAICDVYGLRSPRGAKTKTGSARKAGTGTRPRVTAKLRDQVKSAVKSGKKQAQVAREFSLSAPTVGKIVKGGYDKLS